MIIITEITAVENNEASVACFEITVVPFAVFEAGVRTAATNGGKVYRVPVDGSWQATSALPPQPAVELEEPTVNLA